MKHLLCFGLIVILFIPACVPIPARGPESAARAVFEEWARQAGVPYKDVAYHATKNDNAFATVQIRATLKESALQDWQEKQAEIECRHVGAEWQCGSIVAFSLTPAEQDKQNQAATGTAAANAIKLQATATEQARQLEATRLALAATQAVVDQNANATATAAALAATATTIASVGKPVRVVEVAAGKPATASGFWKATDGHSYPPNNIVDRKIDEPNGCFAGSTSYWLLPDRQTGWAQIDLQQNYKIVKLRWLNTHNGRCGNDRATTQFHIAVSPTGDFKSEEQIIHQGTMAYSLSPAYEETILASPVLARYVRFYVDEYYNWGGGLNELEVYAEILAP